MKVAIIHDWLVTYAGAERVLEQILLLYPEADIFSLVDFIPEKQRGFIQNKAVKKSFIQKMPFARTKYRQYLPLMPLAVEQFDLSNYDVIISSSHAVAKGVITGPNQLHVSYIHSPIRYAWDLQHQYLKESGLDNGLKGIIAKYVLHNIRIWDYRTSAGVDGFVANSNFIAKRIWKVYRRQSTVIYPPVDIDRFAFCEDKEDYYITASRIVPYKKMDLIVEAFTDMPNKKLIVIGDGPDIKKIQNGAGNNITFMGYQPHSVLQDYVQHAKAFVFAAEEDFGIAVVEAQACGTPVIAFGRGGARETVLGLDMHEKPTGVFFGEQTVMALQEAISCFECNINNISSRNCRENSLRFAAQRFQAEFSEYMDGQIGKFQQGGGRRTE